MRVGVVVPMSDGESPGTLPVWAEISGLALHAEELGLDSVWLCDHMLYAAPDGSRVDGMHEAWTILSALAAVTSRIELGQLVMCASFRNPALLAKMAVTADHVSGGRVTLGVGAGWHDPEYDAYGWPTDHKGGRFDEALRIIVPLLRGERVSLDGRFHVARDAALVPAPQRRVPVLVAGERPRMLRLVAEHADAWNAAWYGRPDDTLRRRVGTLDAALDKAGRDPVTLRRTVGVWVTDPWSAAEGAEPGKFTGSASELAALIDEYAMMGFDDLIFNTSPYSRRALDWIAEAVAVRRV
ncbi:LLM class flavin-dependent oxidoreductase [Luedemannella flava]|uniref:LLM class flavin-dependent oxidoreductase n=1 Tax=Luedemannella flava TaxID=349316 RepID=UPI0031DC84E1